MVEAVVLLALVTVVITWVSVASGEARRRREAAAARYRAAVGGVAVGGSGGLWAAAQPTVPRDVHDDEVRRAGDEGCVERR